MTPASISLEERTGRAETQLQELEARRRIRKEFFPKHLMIIETAARASVQATMSLGVHNSSDEDDDDDEPQSPSDDDRKTATPQPQHASAPATHTPREAFADADHAASNTEVPPPQTSPIADADDEAAMVQSVFQVFDYDGDGAWSMTEANQWMRVMEGDACDANDWEYMCAAARCDPMKGLSRRAVKEWYQAKGNITRHYAAIVTESGEVNMELGVISEEDYKHLDSLLDIIFKSFDVRGEGVWTEEGGQMWLAALGWFETWEECCAAAGSQNGVLEWEQVAELYKGNEYLLTKHYESITKQRNEDNTFDADDDEDEGEYCVGGYHRVEIGDVYNERYEITKKLGWGNFSTVWLAKDYNGGPPAALKIGKASSLHDMSEIEVAVLQKTNEHVEETDCAIVKDCAKRVVRMKEFFYITGPHGVHPTMALEAVGPDILKLLTAHSFSGVAPCIVKTLIKHMLEGLTFLHDMGLAHADVKPENVLIQTLDPNGAPVDQEYVEKLLAGTIPRPDGMSLEEFMRRTYSCKVSDFGSSKWVKTDKRPVRQLQTLEYRAPEVVFGYTADCQIDVWSVACTCYELLTGCFLFNPKATEGPLPQDVQHVALFIELMGDIPVSMACGRGWHCANYFNELGHFMHGHIPVLDMEQMIVEKYTSTEEQAAGLTGFLRGMLEIDPKLRAPAHVMMTHPWLKVVEGDDVPFTLEGRKRLGCLFEWEQDEAEEEGPEAPEGDATPDRVGTADTLPSPAPAADAPAGGGAVSKAFVILDLRQRADYADLRREELVERRHLRTAFFPTHLDAIKESARART